MSPGLILMRRRSGDGDGKQGEEENGDVTIKAEKKIVLKLLLLCWIEKHIFILFCESVRFYNDKLIK